MSTLPHCSNTWVIAGLDDESKIDMVQLYLNRIEVFPFPKAKEAVIKAYRRNRRASPFDSYTEAETEKPTATPANVNRELLTFFQGLRLQKQQPTIAPKNESIPRVPRPPTAHTAYGPRDR